MSPSPPNLRGAGTAAAVVAAWTPDL